jgi:multiple sugar transport system ATP-binding protein
MRKGVLQQVDSPQVLYDHPVNLFVAGFIGSPAMNMLEASVEESDGVLSFGLGSQRLTAPPELIARRPALRSYVGRRVIVGIRPEDIEDSALARGDAPDSRLTSTVDLVESMGSEVLVHFGLDAPMAITEHTRELAEDAGEDPGNLDARGETVVVARFGPRTGAREGEPIEAVVDTEHVHVFDPETGLSIFDGSANGSAATAASGSGNTPAAAAATEKRN